MNQRNQAQVTIESIKSAAVKFGRTLTDKQAQAIFTRHNQLIKESRNQRRERTQEYNRDYDERY